MACVVATACLASLAEPVLASAGGAAQPLTASSAGRPKVKLKLSATRIAVGKRLTFAATVTGLSTAAGETPSPAPGASASPSATGGATASESASPSATATASSDAGSATDEAATRLEIVYSADKRHWDGVKSAQLDAAGKASAAVAWKQAGLWYFRACLPIGASGDEVCSASTRVKATPSSKRVKLPKNALGITGALNFREAVPGVVYRSGKLSGLTDADLKRLTKAGVTLVIDLRTPSIAKASPDRLPEGVEYQLVNLFASATSPSTGATPEAVLKNSVKRGAAFVTSAKQRATTAKVLKLIAAADGTVVIHCSEGKDRTGYISALLQLASGADPAEAMADYLLSNSYRANYVADKVKAAKGAEAKLTAYLKYSVQPAFLDASLDALYDKYGSVDKFLKKGLGLEAKTVAKLKAKLSPAE
ncbi:MAG: tyrosine-protein phosphatase [Propionibacteriaceae bacterium]|nr:tyrosine-protein phosphatase [Propionibacteriaceae bacterium]